MQITHFCNSSISVSAGDTRLLCDPWFGPAEQNAWLSFPFGRDDGPKILGKLAPTIVYVSHLHPDHHDQQTLLHLDKETTILIKSFRDRRLFGKLEAQGFTNIIEQDAWTPLTLGEDLEVVIVPATSMVKDEIDAAISYDIDTSILIRCLRSGQVFYNNVDNPTSLSALKEIREFSEKTWDKPVDIACFPVGAASEFPQCFLNIDREAASRRVINAALNEVPERIDALGCRSFFVAGGTYVIRGKHAALSRYIAQPTMEELEAYLAPWIAAGNQFLSLEGGWGVECDTDPNGWRTAETGFETPRSKAEYAHEAQDLPYDYSDVRGDIDAYLERLKAALPGALENYQAVMDRIGITQDWRTEIHLYDHIELDENANLADTKLPQDCVILPSTTDEGRQTLALHMDMGLFVDLLEGRGNWNVALSGSYVLYERTPDFFLPDIPFSLNFLVDRSRSYAA